MSAEVRVLEEGALVITPRREKDVTGHTVTLFMGHSYCKLRNVEVEFDISKIDTLSRDEWHILGEGDRRIAIKKDSARWALQAVPKSKKTSADAVFQSVIGKGAAAKVQHLHEILPDNLDEEIINIATSVLNRAPSSKEEVVRALKKSTVKFTTMMRSGRLAIVARTKSGEGTYKIAQRSPILWQKPSAEGWFSRWLSRLYYRPEVTAIPGPVVRAKARPGVNFQKAILGEVKMSQELKKAGVPHIMDMEIDPRAGVDEFGNDKMSLTMPDCKAGDLESYCSKDYDPKTYAPVSPEEEQKHLRIALQVGEALEAMARAGWSHSDLKGQNILMKKGPGGSDEVVVTDFGLTKKLQTPITIAAGTYPPPESMDACEENKSFMLTEHVDEWAFGVLLYSLIHHDLYLVYALGCDRSISVQKNAWKEILGTLGSPGSSPIHDAIRGLLSDDADKRMKIADALPLIRQRLSQISEAQRSRKRPPETPLPPTEEARQTKRKKTV